MNAKKKNKNAYALEKLSGQEQKLYFLLEAEDRKVATAADAMKLLKIPRLRAYGLIQSLARKGALDKVKSNMYVRIPAHIVHDRGSYAEDPVVVAAHLAKPYFFSYHTALAIHGLAQQAASRVYLSTTRQVNPVSYKGSVIRTIRLDKKRFFGFEKTGYRGEKIAVSDLERTIADVLRRPEYAGGYEEVIRSLADVRGVKWNRLLGYLKRMGEGILLNRAGYVFDLLKEQAGTPDEFLEKLRSSLSGNVYYFEKGRKGKFVGKWKVVVDPRLEKAKEGV